MTTNDLKQDGGSAPGTGPGPFSEEELAAASAGPIGDPEVEELDPAEIDEEGPDPEASFDRLTQKSKKLSPERVRTVIESLLFMTDKPLNLDQLYEATGLERSRIEAALEKLGGIHREGMSGMVLHDVAGGWQ